MNLKYHSEEIRDIVQGSHSGPPSKVRFVAYDSRKIINGRDTLFVGIRTNIQDGAKYADVAFYKGVRCFLISEESQISQEIIENAAVIRVKDPLSALQKLAAHHRRQFSYPVIGITGSAGKTTVKEWLNAYLSIQYKVVRSPKSFNSQLGVALSLLELEETADFALIEAGISQPGEMQILVEMIQPTHGIFTNFDRNHRENFRDAQEHWIEKLQLFETCKLTFLPLHLSDRFPFNHKVVVEQIDEDTEHFTVWDQINIALCESVAQYFGLTKLECLRVRDTLQRVDMRLESREGWHQNQIIVDAFNQTVSGLQQALAYQAQIGKNRTRVLIGSKDFELHNREDISPVLDQYHLKSVVWKDPLLKVYASDEKLETLDTGNLSILFKGNEPYLQQLAKSLQVRKHETSVIINLDALQYNLRYWKQHLSKEMRILVMLKAQSYGTGIGRLGVFLEQQGVAAIGVAYPDEGLELREDNVQLPIIVMNSGSDNWELFVQHSLEPSIFDFHQLYSLQNYLEQEGIIGFPIHLKFDTGMRRLGFYPEDLDTVIQQLMDQPRILVKSIFSHLADADGKDIQFTEKQINTLDHLLEKFKTSLGLPVDGHILNTEGALRFKANHSMVRLGIGLFGITSNTEHQVHLEPVIEWRSRVSQVKMVKKGETVGYSRSYVAAEDLWIGIIPVGYADGFKRSLSNGVGGVFIRDQWCPVVGKVCMDMVMVKVGEAVEVGDEVEIIGRHQTISQIAAQAKTIPYEIMTSLSQRMPRVFVQAES